MMLRPSAQPRIFDQACRFLFAGVLVAALDAISFLFLVWSGVSLVLANALGMLLGFLLGLYIHHRYSFQQTTRLEPYIALKYLAAFFCNLSIGTIILSILNHFIIQPLLAKILVMVVVTTSNFLLGRYMVFKTKSHISKQ